MIIIQSEKPADSPSKLFPESGHLPPPPMSHPGISRDFCQDFCNCFLILLPASTLVSSTRALTAPQFKVFPRIKSRVSDIACQVLQDKVQPPLQSLIGQGPQPPLCQVLILFQSCKNIKTMLGLQVTENQAADWTGSAGCRLLTCLKRRTGEPPGEAGQTG